MVQVFVTALCEGHWAHRLGKDRPMTGAGSPAEPPGAVPGQPSPGQPAGLAWRKLGAEPGLCGACRHAKLNETRRGTAYVRCTRAGWDTRLPRYPTLPVGDCAGFQPH